MRTVSVGDLKANFSEILKDIDKGEKIIVTFGKKSKKMAVIVPFNEYFGKKRKLGLLAKRGKVWFSNDWSMTEEEFVAG
jgi:prevent-host-death family protein